jgi:hypothetical protein
MHMLQKQAPQQVIRQHMHSLLPCPWSTSTSTWW